MSYQFQNSYAKGLPSQYIKEIGKSDKNHLYYAVGTEYSEIVMVGMLDNTTTKEQSVSYTKQRGSTIGFAQQVGISVTGSVGVEIKIVNASVKTTLSANLTASQSFSKSTTTSVNAKAGPGEQVYIYSSTAHIKYYMELPIAALGGKLKRSDSWVAVGSDIVHSGRYEVRNQPLTGELISRPD